MKRLTKNDYSNVKQIFEEFVYWTVNFFVLEEVG